MIKDCTKHGLTEHSKLKNGRIRCKKCQKEYQSKHYIIKKQYYVDKARERCDFLKAYIERVKRFSKCSKCPESRWWVLDFHHTGIKNFSISRSAKRGLSITKIKNEIRNCEILCSNCHRNLHYQESIADGHSDHRVS